MPAPAHDQSAGRHERQAGGRVSIPAQQRPTTTADGAIGIERNRSVMPLAVSACTAASVSPIPNAIVWAKIPGMTNSW